jgi:FlaA1/EpsC-like NDP-sugar epimerase
VPVRTERNSGVNGGRVLTLDVSVGGGPGPQMLEGTRVLTRAVVVGTEETARQVVSGLEGIEGVLVAGCVVFGGGGDSEIGTAPVLGAVENLPLLVARFGIKMAIVCLPASMPDELRRAERVLEGTGIVVRRVMAMEDVIGGVGATEAFVTRPSLLAPPPETPLDTFPARAGEAGPGHRFTGAAPSIDLATLIGRTPYEMDRRAISKILRGKCVMITGAGGSIGSELAKVAAEFEPSLLVLMERSENALFEIDRQLGRHFPKVKRKPVLHDVVDAEATLRLCEKVRPQVVFHAAAHKHVPLMEDHPAHAVTNNLFGTKSIADAAVAVGAERFVMISSDKAVNPTSVMGATKRLAEMYVRGLGERTRTDGLAPSSLLSNTSPAGAEEEGTRLSMVRFGNVLGSAASVLTIWAQQIAEGGPLTITDPRMTRFFMTIPEAATLVVQSATLEAEGAGVGVYVLDMGEPVRIVELAERFVRAHGMVSRVVGVGAKGVGEESETRAGKPVPHRDAQAIDLVCTGIRPGEKLHEELAYAAEQLRPTTHSGVRAWAGPGFGADVAERMREMVDEMNAARFSPDPARVVEAIRKHVPEMRTGPAGASIFPEQASNPRAG